MMTLCHFSKPITPFSPARSLKLTSEATPLEYSSLAKYSLNLV